MGKALIFILLGTLVSFTLITLSVNKNLNESIQISTNQYSEVQARCIAKSMVNILRSELSDSTSLRYTDIKSRRLFNGSVTYTMKDTVLGTDSLVQIWVSAKFMKKSKNVAAYIKIPTGGQTTELPPFADYAIFSTGRVLLEGSNTQIRHASGNTSNANIHSNTTSVIRGSLTNVHGFMTYTQGGAVEGSASYVTPGSNPNGLAALRKVATVPLPSVDASSLRSSAFRIENGPYTLSGNLDLGTRNAPKILYVNGPLTIMDTKITGYGIIVATGAVTARGNVECVGPDPNFNKVAILTESTFRIYDAYKRVDASIHANGQILLEGAYLNINGSIVSNDNVWIRTSILNVNYKPLACEVVGGYAGTATGNLNFSGRLDIAHYYQ